MKEMDTFHHNRIVMTVSQRLPEFSKMVHDEAAPAMILMTQDAFAADGNKPELELLGMAIKYAGLFGKEVTIIL